MTEFPTRDAFAEHIGSTFELTVPPDTRIGVTLAEVSPLKVRPPQEQFSVVLSAPAGSVIEQGMYELTHPELGRLELFLVPIALNEKGLQLQAVFNRLS